MLASIAIRRLRQAAATPFSRRFISTLEDDPHIYVFLQPKTNSSSNSSSSPTHLLSLLPTDPPNPHLAVGSTSEVPPTPRSVTENPHFFTLLQSVIAEHAIHDPAVQSQALAFASQGGATLGSGGMFFPQQRAQRQRGQGRTAATFTGGGGGAGGGGAGGASAQGGMGGGGKAGFVHVSDQRNPPDWGRVAYPEDIFGSLQLDAEGKFVGKGGSYQSSGTYRLCTGDGILRLSPFLREKVIQKLREVESSQKP